MGALVLWRHVSSLRIFYVSAFPIRGKRTFCHTVKGFCIYTDYTPHVGHVSRIDMIMGGVDIVPWRTVSK